MASSESVGLSPWSLCCGPSHVNSNDNAFTHDFACSGFPLLSTYVYVFCGVCLCVCMCAHLYKPEDNLRCPPLLRQGLIGLQPTHRWDGSPVSTPLALGLPVCFAIPGTFYLGSRDWTLVFPYCLTHPGSPMAHFYYHRNFGRTIPLHKT